MGLQCVAWPELVPTPVGREVGSSPHHGEGTTVYSLGMLKLHGGGGGGGGSHQVVYLCDHQAAVACLRSGTSCVPHVMHMLRTLAFVEARLSFSIIPQYIDTRSNHLADDLSWNLLPSFLSKVPHANCQAMQLPMDLLVDLTLDWVSLH